MTTEEKLEKFYTSTLQVASSQAEKTLREHSDALEKLFAEHAEKKQREETAELADEQEKLRRDNNKKLSNEQLQIRRAYSNTSSELKAKLFREVQTKLSAFKESPDYPLWLCTKVREALAAADNDRSGLRVFADVSDQPLFGMIQEQTGVRVSVSDENLLGGIQAVIPKRNILLNYSFSAGLKEAYDSFTFEGLANE